MNIFKAIVGSHSYGTNIPTSDQDIKGVYCQNKADLYSFNYKPQLDVNKDEVYYEIKRFLELAETANPTVIELLFSPEDCVLYKHPAFDVLIKNRHRFLTKKCRHSFGGYAVAQIKKARGLDKKMNWEKNRVTRKVVSDFCHVYDLYNRKVLTLGDFLMEQKFKEEYCGLVGLNHMPNTYEVYYDLARAMDQVPDWESYRGITTETDIVCSSVPKTAVPAGILNFNKDAWHRHCKEFKEYQEWLATRNESRYVDTQTHGQKIDGKNLMHVRRLLDMALEIPLQKTLNVRRPNKEALLKIRRGETNLEGEIIKAEEDLKMLDTLYEESDLPDEVDSDFLKNTILTIRYLVELDLKND